MGQAPVPPELSDLHERARLALHDNQQVVKIGSQRLLQLILRVARAEHDRTRLLERGDALLAAAESPAFGNLETAPGAEGDFRAECDNWREAAKAARLP